MHLHSSKFPHPLIINVALLAKFIIIIIIVVVAGTCEYGDEPSGSKNAGNFLTSYRTSYLLKKDSAQWSK